MHVYLPNCVNMPLTTSIISDLGQAGAILYSTVTTSLPVVMTHANVQGSEAPTVATRVAGCFY